jgi:hypothetical protein
MTYASVVIISLMAGVSPGNVLMAISFAGSEAEETIR